LTKVEPITYKDVESAPRPKKTEDAVKAQLGLLVSELMDLERTSVEVRQELSFAALHIVAGGDRAKKTHRK